MNKSEIFINKAILTHGNKYIYTSVDYVNTRNKVKIICPIHGEFEQLPNHHLKGQNCLKCIHDNMKLSNENFIIKANKIHNNQYDYSHINYINHKNKININCLIHGIFKQLPSNHLLGSGCPICKESKGEKLIRTYLINNNIKFIQQYKFNDCFYKQKLPFDFYIPDYNICIEYHGEQHYKPIKYFGGENRFIIQQNRDNIKIEYCKTNNILLIIIKYDEIINEILTKYFLYPQSYVMNN